MIKKFNLLFYLIMILLFVFLKFAYTLSETNHLIFLLSPTNKIIEFISGYHSVYFDNEGYHFQQLNIIIDKSCSGFNFLIIIFFMLIFLSVNYFKKGYKKIAVVFITFLIAYLATIIVNGFRINSIIIFEEKISSFLNFEKDYIHQAIGILINLTFLILIYLIVKRILNHKRTNEKLT